MNFIASIVYLWKRSAGSDAIAVASAEVGVVFCTVVLITGPIWARPVWGIWWTWDARLTTTLVLWLIYVSYLVLRRFAAGSQTQVLSAALAIFGFVDVPIVFMAIRWFRTQHPSPVIGGGEGSGLDPTMWHAVLWNWLAFSCLALLLVVVRYRLQRMEETGGSRARAVGSPGRCAMTGAGSIEGSLCRHVGDPVGIPGLSAEPLSQSARRDEGPQAVFVRRLT